MRIIFVRLGWQSSHSTAISVTLSSRGLVSDLGVRDYNTFFAAMIGDIKLANMDT